MMTLPCFAALGIAAGHASAKPVRAVDLSPIYYPPSILLADGSAEHIARRNAHSNVRKLSARPAILPAVLSGR
jgi:hypothetical protein